MSRIKIKSKSDPLLKAADDFFRRHVVRGHEIHIVQSAVGLLYQCGSCDPETVAKINEIFPCSCDRCVAQETLH